MASRSHVRRTEEERQGMKAQALGARDTFAYRYYRYESRKLRNHYAGIVRKEALVSDLPVLT